ncbi:ABC transporter substrate-binding protein [Pseudonocardia alni]|uniref:ABC transporter substrate-binding protein n=1 Tax=Pseudonocardia alni TaxID=33907 RepID=UPI0034013408
MSPVLKSQLSRRRFLGLAAGAAASVPILAACGGSSSGGSGGEFKFWDMPWGTPEYNDISKQITSSFAAPAGVSPVTYQIIQWDNFNQTFASAVASRTNPAVSTGGGFQAFQFADQGAIAYADGLVEKFRSNGLYDDFLPGAIDGMKTDKGIVAIPWHLDPHVWWYNKTLLEQAGAKVPTSWDEVVTTGQALKRIGVFGFATGAGSGNGHAYETPLTLMVNNGGGIFAPDGSLDVLNPRNIEAIEFMKQLQGEGIIDPASVSYTNDNQMEQWRNRKFGLGIDQAGQAENVGSDAGKELVVADPIPGPHGDNKTLVVENNIMMYADTPSQEASEAFVEHFIKSSGVFWKNNLINGIPVLKSIVATPEFQKKTNFVTMVEKYQPIGISYSARGETVGVSQAKIDGNSAMFQFGQAVLTQGTDARTALTDLSNGLTSLLRK